MITRAFDIYIAVLASATIATPIASAGDVIAPICSTA
jgi:hypothetical protein